MDKIEQKTVGGYLQGCSNNIYMYDSPGIAHTRFLGIFQLVSLLLFIAFILASCQGDKIKDVDVSKVDVNLKVTRFEKELFSHSIDSVINNIPSLEKKYGEFFELFNYEIINIGGTNTKTYSEYFRKFLGDEMISEVYKKCEKEFSDISDLQDGLTGAFQHYKYYFPGKKVPEVYTYVSGFNQSVVLSENFIGIGLDKYLGAQCDYYTLLGIPAYIKYKMHRKKILSDCVMAWVSSEFPFNDVSDNVLTNMVYWGQVMYALDALLPDEPDTLKTGYSFKQLEWCRENENRIWTYFVENKLLFNSEYMQIKKYLDEAPFTVTLSHEAPGRIGIWVGLQIVKSYMKNNPDVTLPQLMKDSDYMKIFNRSKYNP